jgi:hypothetical protein
MSQKVGGLLAFLAFHLRQVHSREILIEMFLARQQPGGGPQQPECLPFHAAPTSWSRRDERRDGSSERIAIPSA